MLHQLPLHLQMQHMILYQTRCCLRVPQVLSTFRRVSLPKKTESLFEREQKMKSKPSGARSDEASASAATAKSSARTNRRGVVRESFGDGRSAGALLLEARPLQQREKVCSLLLENFETTRRALTLMWSL